MENQALIVELFSCQKYMPLVALDTPKFDQ